MSEFNDAMSTVKSAGKIAMSVANKVKEMQEAQKGQSHMQGSVKSTVQDKDQGQGM